MAEFTKLADLFNPEVLQDGIAQEYPKFLKYIPLAAVDATLQGKAGDTITMPAFRYTGDAVEVGEGELIPLDKLAHSTREVKIKKYGKAIQYTDEAMLSGYGDPVGQIIREHSMAHANKLDNEVIGALRDAKLIHYLGATGSVDSDHIADALALFGEDEPEMLYGFVSPSQLAALRKNEDWIKATDIGVNILINGVRGQIWGVNLIVSNKLVGDEMLIVAPNAVRVVTKRDVMVETERYARKGVTEVVSNALYAAYLYDDSKVVRLVKEAAPTVYTLSFDTDDGRPVASQNVISGETGFEPMPPAKTGFIFAEWVTTAGGSTPFNFETPIVANAVAYASYVADGVATQEDLDALDARVDDLENA